MSHAPRNAETRRAQVFGDNTEIIIDGEVNSISARLPRPLLLLSLRAFTTSHLQVLGEDAKITHTGTNFGGGPVGIIARPLRPSASEGPRRRLPRAQVFSTPTEITVSTPGEAKIFVRDPRPLRTPARESEGTRTQALPKNGVSPPVPVTFECYGVEVTTVGTPSSFLCNGLPGP